MNKHLAKCPFCGLPALLKHSAELSGYYVVCGHCSARGPLSRRLGEEDEEDSENAAVDLWNRLWEVAMANEIVIRLKF